MAMPKIDIAKLPTDIRTGYPPPYDRVVVGRERKRLGNAVELDQFGVNLTTLKPGAASALRHWHEQEDELVFVLEGEVVLIEDGGETVLKPGDAAGFKANSGVGHHIVNKSDRNAVFLDVGTDSIALVTWNAPGRTMNVIDPVATQELSAIVEQIATDAAVKGIVVTS